MGVDKGDVRVFKDEIIQLREKIERLEMVNRDHDLENEALRQDLSEKVLELEKLGHFGTLVLTSEDQERLKNINLEAKYANLVQDAFLLREENSRNIVELQNYKNALQQIQEQLLNVDDKGTQDVASKILIDLENNDLRCKLK